jgi:DNA adenine methylase
MKKLSFFPYIGGKYFMLNKILKLIPSHRIYVEVFGGSAKLLLNKEPAKIEVYNDYNRQIANLFYVTAFKFDEFYEKVNRLIYSREIYNQIVDDVINSKIEELGDVDLAVKTYFKLHSTFSGQLNSKSFRNTLTKNISREFFNNINRLTLIHERLKNVIIECSDFKKLLKKYKDVEDAFIYLDPPYFGVPNYYGVKFTIEDHKNMFDMLKTTKAKWLLSGYANELYDSELKDFYRIEISLPKSSYGLTENTKHKGNTKPLGVEILWANYDIKEMLNEKEA